MAMQLIWFGVIGKGRTALTNKNASGLYTARSTNSSAHGFFRDCLNSVSSTFGLRSEAGKNKNHADHEIKCESA